MAGSAAVIHVFTWIWGTKYGPEYKDRLMFGVAGHFRQPHKFKAVRPPDHDPLIEIPGCFTRLRMFDPAWQRAAGINPGDRMVCLDLDLVVTGELDPLFTRPQPFGILQGVNAANPCPFNGSVWWLDAGYRPDVWADFSIEAAATVPFYDFPDDQAWLAARLPDAAAIGPADGAYAFHKPGWPRGEALPRDARLVAFPGWRDPAGFTHIDWIRKHWLGEAA